MAVIDGWTHHHPDWPRGSRGKLMMISQVRSRGRSTVHSHLCSCQPIMDLCPVSRLSLSIRSLCNQPHISLMDLTTDGMFEMNGWGLYLLRRTNSDDNAAVGDRLFDCHIIPPPPIPMIDCHVYLAERSRRLSWSVLMDLLAFKVAFFARPLAKAANILIIKMVLIDWDWRELPNGCHILFWSNLTSTWKSGMSARFASCQSLSNTLFDQDDLWKVVQSGWLYA